MPSDVGQVAIHPQEMVIAPKGVILGHVEHLLDNAKEGDLDLGPEPGQHRKDNARSPRLSCGESKPDWQRPLWALESSPCCQQPCCGSNGGGQNDTAKQSHHDVFQGTICCSASGTSSGEEHEEHGQVDASVYQSDQKSPPDHDGNANVEALSTSKQQVHFFCPHRAPRTRNIVVSRCLSPGNPQQVRDYSELQVCSVATSNVLKMLGSHRGLLKRELHCSLHFTNFSFGRHPPPPSPSSSRQALANNEGAFAGPLQRQLRRWGGSFHAS